MPKSMLMDGENAKIHIPIFYKEKVNKHGYRSFVVLDDEEGKRKSTQEGSGVEVLNTQWKPQTWQMNNHIWKSSTAYNQATGNQDIDFTKYRENIVNDCLIEWDMVDDKGIIIPVSPQTIGLLPANVVTTMIERYEGIIRLDEEDQGKS